MPIELCRKVTIRLAPEAYARLEEVAARTKRTVSDVVRRSLEGLPVRARRRDDHLQELARQLTRVGNNLNQQTRVLHQLKHRGFLPDDDVLLATLQELRGTVDSISRRLRSSRS